MTIIEKLALFIFAYFVFLFVFMMVMAGICYWVEKTWHWLLEKGR
jgi:hypothetical protein